MDYDNYDAYGNKKQSADNDNATTTAVEVVETAAQQHQQRNNNNDSDSDWSDVEIIANHVPTDDIDVPLVQAAGSTMGTGASANNGNEVLMITSGSTTAAGGSSSTAEKSEHQKHADAINFVASAASKLRNIAIVGDLHSGKSSIARLLATSAAEMDGMYEELTKGKTAKQAHFGTSSTAAHNSAAARLVPFRAANEQEAARLTTLRSHTVSCLVAGERTQTTHLVTITDTPGHPNFIADTLAAVRVSDTVLVTVDVTGTIGAHTEQIIRRAVLQNLRIVLVLTKFDRLLVELHLPPQECFLKMRLLIDNVNNIITSCGDVDGAVSPLVSPLNNSVWFTSAKMNLFFTVETFARKYSQIYKNIDVATLSSRLWGNVRYDAVAKKFTKITNPTQRSSFVTLILEPLFKVIAYSIGGQGFELLNEYLSETPKSPWAAVREAIVLHCGTFHTSAVDALLGSCEGPIRRSRVLRGQYQVDVDGEGAPIACTTAIASSVLIVPTTSSPAASPNNPSSWTGISSSSSDSTFVLVRVINNVLKKGDQMLLVGRNAVSEEDLGHVTVEGIYVRTVLGLVEVPDATCGMMVYVSGVGAKLPGGGGGAHCLLVAKQDEQKFAIPTIPSVFGGMNPPAASPEGRKKRAKDYADGSNGTGVPSAALDAPLLHVSVEPFTAAETRKFEAGVRKMTLQYPGIGISMEETGTYTISGVGELQFETAMTDLRRYDCKNLNVKLSDPFVTFSETVAEPVGILAIYPPSSSRDHLGMTAQRMPDKLRLAIESQSLPLYDEDPMPLFTCLRKDHGWDVLAARRALMSIGPDMTKGGSNILVDDSIKGTWLESQDAAEAVVEGFHAATSQGPLCGAEVRGVHFKLIEPPLAYSQRLVQQAQRCARLALLGANPRLMEPVLAAEIITQPNHVEKIKEILMGKRGNLVAETRIPASPLVLCKAYCPAMDHFGLETQIRALTNGEAFPTFAFDHWAVVPGDPYDATVRLGLLEPARGYQLARDFVLKTRRRKGLSDRPEDMEM